MINGVLNIYKPKGITSFQAVKEIRKITGEKKVGHAGTLDPYAEGILPVCLGKGTKIVPYLMDDIKKYIVSMRLGMVTDTYDMEGKILKNENISNLDSDEIKNVIKSFIGIQNQIPPMYSALKVNGKKLYELAREGVEIERKARKITIHDIKLVSIKEPFVVMEVVCSKGTYIRSLCFDIGEKLGIGACVWSLERTEVGFFNKQNSVHLKDITKENYKEYLLKIDEVLPQYRSCNLDIKYGKLLINGTVLKDKRVSENLNLNEIYKVYSDNRFIGLGEKTNEGFKLIKLLS